MDYPVRIQNHLGARMLDIVWQGGMHQRLPHAELRRRCKCTVCQSARLLGAEPDADEGIRIEALQPVGHYGLQLSFSDGHERGIYPWDYLSRIACA